jgi:probable HAF family extracellular repeat protein
MKRASFVSLRVSFKQSERAFATSLFLFCLIPTLAVTQVYQVTDLGQLSPTAINDGGQVVSNQNGQAFLWTQSAGPVGLGTLTGGISSYASSINDLGAIVGTADGPGTVISLIPSAPNQDCADLTQPFVWTPTKGMQGLGTVAGPSNSPWDFGISGFWCEFPFYGTGINDSGEVVGYTGDAPDLYQFALLSTSAGGMTTFGSSWSPTFANGVSNTGQIVGQSLGEIGNAAYWKNGVETTLVDLGAGAGLDYTSSANGVNDQGQVVGWSTTIPFDPDCNLDLTVCPIHAVLWAPDGGITDLGTVPSDTLSAATNINFFGQVIGTSGSTLGTEPLEATGGAGFDGGDPITVIGRPFIWTQTTGMQDLNALIPANSGWVLNTATGINIWGQIVGTGTLNGQSHGFLLTPASGNETQTVSGLTTEPTVTSSLNPSLFKQQVTFTATVTGQTGDTPTGTVTFSDGSTILGTVPLSGDTAALSTSLLAGGVHPINAFYSGDSNFIGGAGSLNQVVTQANTMLTLIPSVNPSGFGQPVTFTTMITPLYGGQATGTVTFKDGTTTLGSTAVSGNLASLTTSSLAFGIHSITAVYSGDSNFIGGASNTLSQVVRAATTTTLLSSINPSVQDKSVTFTATVSSLAATRTGTVQFLNGTAALATVTLKSGTAKLTTSQLPPGPNPITAVYSGDTNNSANTSGTVNQLVQAPTTITLASSPASSAYGQAVIFTGDVTSSIGAPPDGEAVSFKQGSTVLGTGILSSGMASISVSTLGVGDKAITGVYGGDANFTSSKSEVLSQVVGAAATTTTLVSSVNSSNYKQSVTFTATVVPQFGGTVTGSATFMDGATVLKTVGVSGGIAKYTTSTLAPGAHNITATYNSSADFTSSSGAVTQTVN